MMPYLADRRAPRPHNFITSRDNAQYRKFIVLNDEACQFSCGISACIDVNPIVVKFRIHNCSVSMNDHLSKASFVKEKFVADPKQILLWRRARERSKCRTQKSPVFVASSVVLPVPESLTSAPTFSTCPNHVGFSVRRSQRMSDELIRASRTTEGIFDAVAPRLGWNAVEMPISVRVSSARPTHVLQQQPYNALAHRRVRTTGACTIIWCDLLYLP